MIKKIFKLVEEFSEELEGEFSEISVKQSQISFCFPELFVPNDLTKLDNFCKTFKVTDVTTFQDEIYVNFNDLSTELISDEDVQSSFNFASLYLIIKDLQKCLCSCPALQFVVSLNYIKVFLDVPNITIDGLVSLNELFSADGILELNIQRPYVLYVKDW